VSDSAGVGCRGGRLQPSSLALSCDARRVQYGGLAPDAAALRRAAAAEAEALRLRAEAEAARAVCNLSTGSIIWMPCSHTLVCHFVFYLS